MNFYPPKLNHQAPFLDAALLLNEGNRVILSVLPVSERHGGGVGAGRLPAEHRRGAAGRREGETRSRDALLARTVRPVGATTAGRRRPAATYVVGRCSQ